MVLLAEESKVLGNPELEGLSPAKLCEFGILAGSDGLDLGLGDGSRDTGGLTNSLCVLVCEAFSVPLPLISAGRSEVDRKRSEAFLAAVPSSGDAAVCHCIRSSPSLAPMKEVE